MTERTRDIVTGELTLDYFVQRAAQGWKLAAVEWMREASTASAGAPVAIHTQGILNSPVNFPYGLRLSESGQKLEENPLEMTVLLLILQQIVKEKRISDIAIQLNLEGYQTRDGQAWSPTAVFELLPRLIEVSPAVLKSDAWMQLRPKSQGPATLE